MRHRLRRTLIVLAAASALSAAASAHAGLVATYQFNNTLAADQPGAPALTPINDGSFVADSPLGQPRTVYQRTSASNASSDQSALRLDTTPLGLTSNNYAVELVFTFTDTLDPRAPGTNFRRIINAEDPVTSGESGLYLGARNSVPAMLDIYEGGSHAGGPALSDGTYYDVVLSVSPGGEEAYVNGALATSFAGAPDRIATHFLTFFQDNTTEYGNGKVALIRVFDSALSGNEVIALHNNGDPFPAASVPEPSSIVMSGASVLYLLCVCRRRLYGRGKASRTPVIRRASDAQR